MATSLAASSNEPTYGTLVSQDPEAAKLAATLEPVHWQGLLLKGAGQWEYQGFEDWTPDEQALYKQGKLQHKWGVGQVSIRLPFADPITIVAVIYGYLPYVIPIWWGVWALYSYLWNGMVRFFPTFGVCIAVFFAIINECITKPLVHMVIPEALSQRPAEAVCRHPGMPSGHVLNSWTIMIWMLLEAIFDKYIYPEWLVAIILCMGPVPWSRVHNRDHTVLQVTVSCIISVFLGAAAYAVRHTFFPGHGHPWHWWAVSEGYKNGYARLLEISSRHPFLSPTN
mmetsp:Transcript_46478/g.99523  ORF Transcript_46478/g.99523 Transcript_46478/m.99523 type:complete len:282 (+) Transcript_46478:35-880(+)